MYLHVGDVGTILRGRITDGGVPVDVSGASVKELLLHKPSGAVVTKTAAFTTSGTDGRIQYVTVAADLDDVGVWYLSARVVLASGTWSTDRVPFEVRR